MTVKIRTSSRVLIATTVVSAYAGAHSTFINSGFDNVVTALKLRVVNHLHHHQWISSKVEYATIVELFNRAKDDDSKTYNGDYPDPTTMEVALPKKVQWSWNDNKTTQLEGILEKHNFNELYTFSDEAFFYENVPGTSNTNLILENSQVGETLPLQKAFHSKSLKKSFHVRETIVPMSSGGYGDIYRARSTSDPIGNDLTSTYKYVCKIINKEKAESKRVKQFIIDEVKLNVLLTLKPHKNIVSLDSGSVFEDPTDIFMVMPNYSGGSLSEMLWGTDKKLAKGDLPGSLKGKPLSVATVVDIMRQLMQGLAHLHQLNIIHRDINLDNLVLDGDGVLKIIDFGLAKRTQDADVKLKDEFAGRTQYMAPEGVKTGAILAKAYQDKYVHNRPVDIDDVDAPGWGYKVDVWSAGIVMYELLTGGNSPLDLSGVKNVSGVSDVLRRSNPLASGFSGKYKLQGVLGKCLNGICNGNHPLKELDDITREFLEKILQPDPTKRPTAKECLEHPFLAEAGGQAVANGNEMSKGSEKIRSATPISVVDVETVVD